MSRNPLPSIKNHHPFLILSVLVAAAPALATLPNHARAFWPFATADASPDTFIPASATPTLKAPINIDPNPHKGLAYIPPSSGSALIAYAGPSGTATDIVGSTKNDSISLYVVRPGDTLSEIAKMFDVSVNTIIWANEIKGGTVHPGDTLVILPISGVEHTVVKGDTIKSIAKKYGGDVEEVAQFNGVDENATLEIGSTIIVPGGEVAPPPAPKSPARPGTAPIISSGGAPIHGYYSNPVPGAAITQGLHGRNGVDFGAPRGTPIHAAAAGTVIVSRSNGAWNGGYGNYVVITHPNGTQTLYSHLTYAIVAAGQQVANGQVIGYMGSTGKSTGVHLHFEVRGAANPFRSCPVGTVCVPR